MNPAQARPERAQPVERFRPTSGRAVGYLSLAVIAGLVLYLALYVRSTTGLQAGTGLLFVGILVWVTQLRPRATAYPDELRLQNSLRDASVPLSAIDDVSVGRMLDVRAGGERFVCVGIGKPLRKMVRNKNRGTSMMLGWDRIEDYTEAATPPSTDQTAIAYQDFVESRIASLVKDAKRRSEPGGPVPGEPRRTWAWPEIAALAVTGLAFALALLL